MARRRALTGWLLGDRVDDVVVVVRADGAPGRVDVDDRTGGERWSVQELLYALWDDPAPVPDELVTLLGLPADASFAATVRLLDLQRREASMASFAEVVDDLTRESRDPDRPRRIVPRT